MGINGAFCGNRWESLVLVPGFFYGVMGNAVWVGVAGAGWRADVK